MPSCSSSSRTIDSCPPSVVKESNVCFREFMSKINDLHISSGISPTPNKAAAGIGFGGVTRERTGYCSMECQSSPYPLVSSDNAEHSDTILRMWGVKASRIPLVNRRVLHVWARSFGYELASAKSGILAVWVSSRWRAASLRPSIEIDKLHRPSHSHPPCQYGIFQGIQEPKGVRIARRPAGCLGLGNYDKL
jgi:hypothetical protein